MVPQRIYVNDDPDAVMIPYPVSAYPGSMPRIVFLDRDALDVGIRIDIVDIVEAIDFDGVFDGELLVRREEAVAPFNDLQQRLNRKAGALKHFILYELRLFTRHTDFTLTTPSRNNTSLLCPT